MAFLRGIVAVAHLYPKNGRVNFSDRNSGREANKSDVYAADLKATSHFL